MSRIDQVIEVCDPAPAKHYVVMILDRSGSMESIATEARLAFNQQVEDSKAAAAADPRLNVEVCLVTFSTNVDKPEVWCEPINTAFLLTEEDYKPHGWTALKDAIGFTIQGLLKEPDINDPRTTVLMTVITDGQDNMSKEFVSNRLRSIIKQVQDTGRWTITLEGSGIEINDLVRETGLHENNTMSFDAGAQAFSERTITRSRLNNRYYSVVSNALNKGGNLSVDRFNAPSTDDQDVK